MQLSFKLEMRCERKRKRERVAGMERSNKSGERKIGLYR